MADFKLEAVLPGTQPPLGWGEGGARCRSCVCGVDGEDNQGEEEEEEVAEEGLTERANTQSTLERRDATDAESVFSNDLLTGLTSVDAIVTSFLASRPPQGSSPSTGSASDEPFLSIPSSHSSSSSASLLSSSSSTWGGYPDFGDIP